MKNRVLKVIAATSLMVVMAVGIQMNRVENTSTQMMKNLINIAMADGESECPGGSCSYYESGWVYNPNSGQNEWKEKLVCSTCCAEGQSANCDFTGCSCS